jgi:hypothetical protein
VEITPEEKSNPDKFYWKQTRDIIYSNINVTMVQAYLAERKKKTDGSGGIHSFETIRKYHDAILWGASRAQQALPDTYLSGMNTYLKGK